MSDVVTAPRLFVVFGGYAWEKDKEFQDLAEAESLNEAQAEELDERCQLVEDEAERARGWGAAVAGYPDLARAKDRAKEEFGGPLGWWHIVDTSTLRIVDSSEDSQTVH